MLVIFAFYFFFTIHTMISVELIVFSLAVE